METRWCHSTESRAPTSPSHRPLMSWTPRTTVCSCSLEGRSDHRIVRPDSRTRFLILVQFPVMPGCYGGGLGNNVCSPLRCVPTDTAATLPRKKNQRRCVLARTLMPPWRAPPFTSSLQSRGVKARGSSSCLRPRTRPIMT